MTDKRTPPLTPAVLHILIALSAGELHGYAIMKQVQQDSDGEVSMGPGTLYGSLNRMMAAGLVAESAKRSAPELDDARRIYYRITPQGKAALDAELQRLEQVVAVARQRKTGLAS
ncbi:MAG: helix-turn-helix transcriptional regulator [Anaerolineales bacterium]|nr:helix-turn-helix transcriptional regulator [Anaerolineales bacterium]